MAKDEDGDISILWYHCSCEKGRNNNVNQRAELLSSDHESCTAANTPVSSTWNIGGSTYILSRILCLVKIFGQVKFETCSNIYNTASTWNFQVPTEVAHNSLKWLLASKGQWGLLLYNISVYVSLVFSLCNHKSCQCKRY